MAETKAKDAVALLKDDHRTVEDLFAQYEKATGDGRKQKLATQICTELSIHAQIEEEIFYPACEGKVELSMGQQILVTRVCHTPTDCTGFMGSILGGQPSSFDACCERENTPTSFCAPRDPTLMMIARYTCQP